MATTARPPAPSRPHLTLTELADDAQDLAFVVAIISGLLLAALIVVGIFAI